MSTGQKLSGINPLAYVGVEPSAPPQVIINGRQPKTTDYNDYNIGTWWLMIEAQEVWILISKVGGSATWIQLFPGAGGGASSFPTDAGTANEAGNTLNILGGTNINTSGAGNTVTVNLDNSISLTGTAAAVGNITTNSQLMAGTGLVVTGGGILSTGTTRFTTLNTRGVMQTTIDGTVFSDAGTNGQLLIGAGGSFPDWANLSSSDGSITITEGPRTLDIKQSGSGGGNISFLAYVTPIKEVFVNDGTAGWSFAPGASVPMTERFDIGNNFNPGNGAGTGAFFTAPTTSKYSFQGKLRIRSGNGIVVAIRNLILAIGTTGGAATGFITFTQPESISGGNYANEVDYVFTFVIDLDAADTVTFTVYHLISTGLGDTVQIEGAVPAIPPLNIDSKYSWISGFIVQ